MQRAMRFAAIVGNSCDRVSIRGSMRTRTMNKWMVAAGLFAAACGTTPDTGETVLTIEPNDEVVSDGARWWTSNGGPLVNGRFVGTASAIELGVRGTTTTAVISSDTWAARLPADAIAASDTRVIVTMIDESGARVELDETFVLDTIAPKITLAPSTMRDERGDVIDFSTGEPVHDHEGDEMDLAAGGCVTVYKHAYLGDALFGRQTAPNPLALNFAIREAMVSQTHYRVRDASDRVLLDWTPVVNVTGGPYRVELERKTVPALADYAGELHVDMLVRDWNGLEAIDSACIDYRPLAAPLQTFGVDNARGTWNGMPSLVAMTMRANSPMSVLSNTTLGPAIATQRIVQYTAEPIAVALAMPSVGMSYARTYVDDYVATETQPLSNTTCDDIDCSAPPADPADFVSSGPVATGKWTLVLVDETTNQVVTAVGTNAPIIPARAANEAPRAYRLVAHLGQVEELSVKPGVTPAEHTLNGVGYTGIAPFDPQTRCSKTEEKCRMDVCVTMCTESTTYVRMLALDDAKLDMSGLSFELRTSPRATFDADPLWSAPRTFSLGPTSWLSGDADLPGPH
jgi:hypothetical protein